MIVLVGSMAALLTALCWVPQVVRSWKRRSVHDFSWPYLALLVVGVALWCLYGVLRSDPPIYLCNAFVLASVLVITVIKVRGPGPQADAQPSAEQEQATARGTDPVR